MRLLTLAAVCKAAGITRRQADYWCRLGLFVPIREADGSGFPRGFAEADLRVIQLVAHLMRLGAGAQVAARVVEDLREKPPEAWTGLLFIDERGQQSLNALPPAAWVIDLDACSGRERLLEAV